MMWALDHLGGAKYGDLLVREHPEGWACGIFANTFGNAWPTIDKLLATGRCPQVRVHGLWTNHTYNPSRDDKLIKKELKKAKELAAKFPAVDVQYSPICEHNIKGQQLKTLMTWLLNDSGPVLIVNSVFQGDFYQGVINEVHGSHKAPAGPYNYSTDGDDCFDVDIEKLKDIHARAKTFYLWTSQFNGKMKATDTTPINQRKAWPTSQLIDATIYLHNSQGSVNLPKKWLNKPKSDQHTVPPGPRELKPVMIAPVKAQRLELRADNGQVVAVSGGSQPFADGRFRYYFAEYGYQISQKAMRIQGSPIVKLSANGKMIGTCNMAFRQNEFR